MAVFEPTAEEKAASSYLDWDNEELGKFTKYIGLLLEAAKNDQEGLHRVTASSCAMLLIGMCVDSNAGELSLKLDGYTHKNLPEGDWTILVKKRTRRTKS